MLGSGGREHALAWKLAQSPQLGVLYCATGNPGIGECAELVELDASDHDAVIAFCQSKTVGLVVIGPEAPLVGGLSDSLRTAGIPVFGPSQAAAQLEGSKAFTKALCARAGIPTAAGADCASREDANAALDRFAPPFVLKADGLAAGKGVVICADRKEAEEAIDAMFTGAFGEAGHRVVVEEFLDGEEVSVFALTDGETVIPFGSAQDHKRVGEGDTGANTGGMGAYSPAPVLSTDMHRRVFADIIEPTVRTMAAEGTPFAGVLYAGVMLTTTGPKLIEYNVRFGDPECQVLMMRLSSDLLPALVACANGTLAELPRPAATPDTALTVVLATRGYPESPEKGGALKLPEDCDGGIVFHAGTARDGEALVAAGGRVLNATAMGSTVAEAKDAAYRIADAIDFPSGFYRRDIGWREVAREQEAAQ